MKLGLPDGEIVEYLAYCGGAVSDVEWLCTDNQPTHADSRLITEIIRLNFKSKESEDERMRVKFNRTNHLKCFKYA